MNVITSDSRKALLDEALKMANDYLMMEHKINEGVRYLGQWPPKANDSSEEIDERPDIDLALGDRRIDIIYLRSPTPEMPERLKSVANLTEDIVEKVLKHLFAERNPKIFISEVGTKFDTQFIKNHSFRFDEEGYIRIDDWRICEEVDGKKKPLKARDFRSHDKVMCEDLGYHIVNFFGMRRLDGKKNLVCHIDLARASSLDQLVPELREEARPYHDKIGGVYIPIIYELPKKENWGY